MKRFLYRNVYSSATLERDRANSTERLTELFEYLMTFPEKVPGTGLGEETRTTPLYRAVCDYIAGMTDRYFVRVYATLIGML